MIRPEAPQFINGRDVIIASSYRRANHLSQVREASRSMSQSGFHVYPTHNAEAVNIGEDFVFLGDEMDYEKTKIERFFLEGIKRARLLYVVTTGGYIGKSTSIETAYSLAVGTPVIISESIKSFGNEVPQAIRNIIQSVPFPIIPTDEITKSSSEILDIAQRNGNSPYLSYEQRGQVFRGLIRLLKDLR